MRKKATREGEREGRKTTCEIRRKAKKQVTSERKEERKKTVRGEREGRKTTCKIKKEEKKENNE